EERYERLAASAPDAIVVEASGRVVFANPALRKLLGLQPSAPVAGRALADFLHPDERGEVAQAAAGAAAAGPAGVRLATRMRRGDGSTAEVEGAATAVTYRGRPAVQILMREVVDDRPAAADDVYRDALTGLTSPLLLPDRLSVAISQAYRHRARVGVVHVDVDSFAAANARLGRHVADRVLRAVARRLSHCVRQGDTAARLEADAFVLVLPGLHHGEDATRIAEKVLRAIRKPFPLADGTVPLTASVGVAIFPEDGEDAPALLASAEQSARRAHEAGGDRLESSAPPPLDDGYDALELEAGLRAALGRGDMDLNDAPTPAGVLHYQPIYALSPRKVVGVEALLRWQHPQLGLVFPQSFLSRSDFTGLILAIGPWILRTAAVQVREWQRRQRGLRLAVNLSPPELMKKTLPDEVKAAIEETGLPARLLQLEVPEGHVVSDLPRSLDMLHRLKALGVSLVLDRFAVRYSSLGRLAELPLDAVKLDLAFLRGPSSNPEDVSLLTAVTAVARGLKLRVCAQGVETAAQLALLERLGCAEAQGFHLAPPVPPATLADQLGGRPAKGGGGKG
ncbi:MAG TPA: bifunctional diguanylate cyclase/phosphodiesterase, partial [Vicinamibacteria bacterium]|nr:bifunctional diguanylate cyclase/phosphodiesterase [Vicinamibacteria bacterium]